MLRAKHEERKALALERAKEMQSEE